MRIVVTFDTPYDGWDHPDHERQMATEVAAWKHDEPGARPSRPGPDAPTIPGASHRA